MSRREEYWEDPDVVEHFAQRDPDHRLQELVKVIQDPGSFRVLDLGCAGGRNTLFLAELGFDVHALDASAGMVEKTQSRLSALLNREAAEKRVRRGPMHDLSFLASESVDLVIALGILQHAETMEEWHSTVAEAARVLRPGGRLLVAHFTPGVDLTGEGVSPVPGTPHTFTGMPGSGTAILMEAPTLEVEVARHGLRPLVESQTVVVPTDTGRRVTVNGLFRKE